MAKKRILFVCTHNSGRSQMAEAFLNALAGDRYEAVSAGTEPRPINPHVITAMREAGIDISHRRSKSVDEFLDLKFDLVVTLCDSAKESCPYFPGGASRIHQSFPDPSGCRGAEPEILECVRRIRDDIKNWIVQAFK
ncbi:MAG: arsenate reductase ArsC [Acidobacteriota bacterium]